MRSSCSSGGGAIATEACSVSVESGDGRTVFSMAPSGQLKMPRLGNYCVTVGGEGAASANIARSADLAATSTNAQHAVSNLADGDAQTYWASASDPTAPIDVQLDFGAPRQIQAVEIDWEQPAQALAYFVAPEPHVFPPLRSLLSVIT